MEINPKFSLFLIFFLLIIISGCTQVSPSFAKPAPVTIHEDTPTLLAGPQAISKPGYYQLTQDVKTTNTTGKKFQLTCIEIRSSDVVFDGMGHTIDGSLLNPIEGQVSYGVQVNRGTLASPVSDVIIRNITVMNWDDGFSLWGANNFTIENVRAINNSIGVSLRSSSSISIKNSNLATNGEGIEGQDIEKVFIVNNTITSSKSPAINLDGQTQQNIYINFRGFFKAYPFYHYVKTTSGNGHIIANNELIDNKEGIILKTSSGNLIGNNRLQSTKGCGVSLEKVDNSIIANNSICAISFLNCGLNNELKDNTYFGNGTRETHETRPDYFPSQVIIGILLVFLLGTVNIVSKAGSSKIIKKVSGKFPFFDEKVGSALHNRGISKLFENPVGVSILGTVIFGGAFAYSKSVNLTTVFFCILMLISGIVTVIPRVIKYLIARRSGIPVKYQMWWGGIFILFFTAIFSMVVLGLGNVFGQPIRTEIAHEDQFEKKKMALTNLAGPVVCILFSFVFFFLYLSKGTFVALWQTGLQMSLLSALVMLLPLSPVEGEKIFAWNKFVWIVLFVPVLFAYFGCLIISY
jgi:parallel beta-helix repeat protein